MTRLQRFIFVCLLFGSTAAAQESRDSAVMRGVSTLSPGDRIRVGLLLERWTGRHQGYNGDTLFLATKGGPPMAIRFNAIDTLWRAGRATGRGAGVGMITGALLGGLVMGLTADDDANGATAVFVGAAGGAAGGGISGALIGSLLSRWHRIFP